MIRVAKTENGMVRGLPAADPRITSFKGIPFAAPPVGENRWRAPQPCADWEGIKDAYAYAPISVQDTPGLGTDIYCREWHVDPDIPMDEDCLYLNVWTPAKSVDEKLPVLVWYFGGALQWGYPAEMEFDGERIARRGIVVVSVNYRLGALGFLAHPQLTREQPGDPTNFGHLDQKAGLQWVVRNIANFGGDPDQITICGQSAGGGSVLSQLTCADNFDIIKRAIILSGMIRFPYKKDDFIIPKRIEEVEKVGEKFFEYLGVKTLEEARAIDPYVIRSKYAEFRGANGMFGTVIDGVFCVDEPYRMYLNNERAQVPVMSGNTGDEFPSEIPAANLEELKACAKEIFGDQAEEFLSFAETVTPTGHGTYASVSGIECTVKNAFLASQKHDKNLKGYYYRFDADIPGWDHPGTFHSVDLWFFFETLAKCWRPFTGKHYDLARQMCNYWVNFIKTGDPNGQDSDGSLLPRWEHYTEEHPYEMVFTTEGGAKPYAPVESEFKKFIMKAVDDNCK